MEACSFVFMFMAVVCVMCIPAVVSLLVAVSDEYFSFFEELTCTLRWPVTSNEVYWSVYPTVLFASAVDCYKGSDCEITVRTSKIFQFVEKFQ